MNIKTRFQKFGHNLQRAKHFVPNCFTMVDHKMKSKRPFLEEGLLGLDTRTDFYCRQEHS